MQRRLAAVLAADFAGYSARVQENEIATVQAVRGHLDALELLISLNRGRVVKTMGDGILAEFGSAVDAVSCAAAMQERMAERNADVAAGRGMDLRIGVHVADILSEAGDIFGDGVNIVARIESVAPPGGVVISARVHDDIAGRTALTFSEIGAHNLKNIARPITLFRLERGAVPLRQPAPALPDKPSLAVLPLANMSSEPAIEYLADGLTEDIITALAHVPWLFVIARNSTFAYKGIASDVRQIGRDLGVAYVFEGSVRKQGNRLRITGQLVDARTGAHLWAQRFDGTDEDIFDLQDRVTEAVAAAIAPSVQLAEMQKARLGRPEDRSAYDHYLRALSELNRARIPEAIEQLDRAIEIEPGYAKALAIRAWCCTLQVAWLLATQHHEIEGHGVELALRALDMDQHDLEVAAYAGYALGFFHADVARSRSLLATATEACPSFVWAWTARAIIEGFNGDGETALAFAATAERLNPRDPMKFRTCIVRASVNVRLQRWEEALAAANEGIRYNPTPIILYVHATTSLVRLGRQDEADQMAQRLMMRNPDFRVSGYLDHYLRSRTYDLADLIGSALLSAGLPE